MASAFRVTQRTMSTGALNNLQENLSRMQTMQEHLSSGKAIGKPSDSPTGTVAALRYRSDIRRSGQYVRNAQDGLGWLGTADTALTKVSEVTRRVRDLLMSSVNGAIGPGERDAIAAEVDVLRQELISLANTTYQGRPVFAGKISGTQAYDAAGNYLGSPSPSPVERAVAPGMKVQVNMTGEQIFGPNATDLFKVVAEIANDLRTNPGDLAVTDLTNLDAASTQILNSVAGIGSRYLQVETMRARMDDAILEHTNGLAEVESIDLPKAITELQMQEMAYKAALSATSRTLQPSLMDFMR